MKMEIRYNNHPEDIIHYDTNTLRDRFLMENVFIEDIVNMTYSHHDRIIFGGVMPKSHVLSLPITNELGTSFFLERREMGIINVGGEGYIMIDNHKTVMKEKDGLYIGRGSKDVLFGSVDSNNPARFYVNSAPAHQTYPNKHIPFDLAKPNHLGSPNTLNERTIYQYVHPDVCQSCQLVMGMTILKEGSVWNTMPCHTHERRMEVYFYFNMDKDTRVFHFMGRPEETRHLVISNEQAIISPSWSIHTGVGTSNYTFIWGMCGENQTFSDMDFVPMSILK